MEMDDRDALAAPESIHALLSPWLDHAAGDYELIRGAVYQFHALIAPRWRSSPSLLSSGVGAGTDAGGGRVLIAGDAGHVMPPFLGQGLNQVNRLAYNEVILFTSL